MPQQAGPRPSGGARPSEHHQCDVNSLYEAMVAAWHQAVLKVSSSLDDVMMESFNAAIEAITDGVAEDELWRKQRMAQPTGRDQEADDVVAAVARGLRKGLQGAWGIPWYKLVSGVCRDFVAILGFNPPAGSIAKSWGYTGSRAGSQYQGLGPSHSAVHRAAHPAAHPAVAPQPCSLADGGFGGPSDSSSGSDGETASRRSKGPPKKGSQHDGDRVQQHMQAQTAAILELLQRPAVVAAAVVQPEPQSRKPVGEVRLLIAQQGAIKAHDYRASVTHWMTLNYDLLTQKQGMRMQAIQVTSSSSSMVARAFLLTQVPELERHCPGSGVHLLKLLTANGYGSSSELKALAVQVQAEVDLQFVPPEPRELLQLYASLVQRKFGTPTPEELQMAYNLKQGVKTLMHAGVGPRESITEFASRTLQTYDVLQLTGESRQTYADSYPTL